MIFFRYYLEFEKFHPGILKEALDLRNREFVRRNMMYSVPISWEQHVRWFESLDPETNFYFLIRMNNQPVGVINIKDIEWDIRRAELGIFIGVESLLGTPTPFICCLTLADLAVKLFRLEPYTKVRSGAREVEAINTSLGFELAEDHGEYIINNLNIEKHYRLTRKLRVAACSLSSGFTEPDVFKMRFRADDGSDPGCRVIHRLLNELPESDKSNFTMI